MKYIVLDDLHLENVMVILENFSVTLWQDVNI